jgi:hypothetical protein
MLQTVAMGSSGGEMVNVAGKIGAERVLLPVSLGVRLIWGGTCERGGPLLVGSADAAARRGQGGRAFGASRRLGLSAAVVDGESPHAPASMKGSRIAGRERVPRLEIAPVR